MVGIVICIMCSIVASVITTRILATHYFKIVDGYVDEICKDKTSGQIKEVVLSPDELPQHNFRT